MYVNRLKKARLARDEVVNWLSNRPRVGLDVTDVLALVDGFDYVVELLLEKYKESPSIDVLDFEDDT